MARPGQCDEDSNLKNQQAATNRQPTPRHFDPIPNVTITEVTGDMVKFSALDEDGNRREYGPVPWGDEGVMWAYCPSSLPSTAEDPGPPANPGPPPGLYASGTLYIEDVFRRANNIGLAPGGELLTPKFPTHLAGGEPLTAEMKVRIDRLVLKGLLLVDAHHDVELDLLNRGLVEPQTLVLDDGAMEVRLTEEGRLALEAAAVVRIAPTQLGFKGMQLENGLEVVRSFDLMDGDYAIRRQKLVLDGEPALVRLRQFAFQKFLVVFPV